MTTLVAIRSVASPDHVVRLDGTGVTSLTGPGGGTVNTQTYISTYETFNLVRNSDGTVSFGSTVFDKVFLRMDASDITQGTNVPQGGGVVNAQFTASTLEKFHINKKAGDQYQGVVGIESDASRGRFLRLDASAGKVNAQGIFSTLEEFEILVVG